MSDKLTVFDQILFDDNISKQEFHTYQPYTKSYNNYDEIRIMIQDQDIYTAPYLSYIFIEGEIIKDETTQVKLTNNPFAFLFEEIRYELNGFELDKVRNVGITSTMKGYVSYGENESKSLQTAGWYPTTGELKNYIGNKFFAHIPLRFLLGFAEDYKKIIINSKQELVLLRSRTDLNSYIITNDNKDVPVQIQIHKLEWHIPHIWVNDQVKIQFLNKLKVDKPLLISFRKWELHELPALKPTEKDIWPVKTTNNLERPRFILIAFQQDRKENTSKDASGFDHALIRNIKVFLNSETYPYDNLNLHIRNGNYVTPYNMYTNFQQSYYNRELSNPLFDYESFKNHMIYVFDCSKQNESIKSSTIDLRIEIEAEQAFPSNIKAYCLILYDTVVEYTPLTGIVRKLF